MIITCPKFWDHHSSSWSTTSAHYVENGITYDKNGNILTLQRTAAGSIVDNLSYTYTGNQLTGLTENVSSSASNDIFVRGANALGNYTYDVNGNMITDSRKNLQFEYNLLNLPKEVKSGNVVKAKYVYTSDGAKLQVRDGDATNGYDYAGSFVFKKNSSGLQLELINFSNGVIVPVGSSYQVNYFLRDHLGSTRAVVDGTGAVKEQSDYYAFGSRQKRADYTVSENRYRYNGKELQTTGDLGYLDYGARMYMPEVGRWFNVDPLAEKNAQYTPYAYCYNNPINVIDPDGKDGVYITFTKYRADGYPLTGHSGVLLIDNKNGTTKYYEYGRYTSNKGNARNYKVPNVVMKDGKPTTESLDKVFSKISEKSGHSQSFEGAYVESDDFDAMKNFAESKIKEGEKGEPYSITSNNCATFADDVIKQDKNINTPITTASPIVNVKMYQRKFTSLSFDPSKGTMVNYKDKTVKYDKETKKTTEEQNWWQRLWN